MVSIFPGQQCAQAGIQLFFSEVQALEMQELDPRLRGGDEVGGVDLRPNSAVER